MSRTLLISDLHNRIVQAQKLIDTVPHDKCILLGDYFDQFNDTYQDAHNTALWLKEFVLDNPKIIPLIGNHCQSYIWSYNPFLFCSGFSEMKSHAINKVLNHEDKKKFKFFTIEQGFVLSHAGLTLPLWKEMRAREAYDGPTHLDFFSAVLQHHVDKNIEAAERMNNPWLFGAGWDRGGMQNLGGITWVDWRSFIPIKHINQIVGHTPHNTPEFLLQNNNGSIKKYTARDYYRAKIKEDNITSTNIVLDTHSNHYAILEDGKIDIWDRIQNVSIKDTLDISVG